jgi:hypothetical protein
MEVLISIVLFYLSCYLIYLLLLLDTDLLDTFARFGWLRKQSGQVTSNSNTLRSSLPLNSQSG